MDKFTDEEMQLINLFGLLDRKELIANIKECLPFMICPDEIKTTKKLIDKLECITDGEYDGLGWVLADTIY